MHQITLVECTVPLSRNYFVCIQWTGWKVYASNTASIADVYDSYRTSGTNFGQFDDRYTTAYFTLNIARADVLDILEGQPMPSVTTTAATGLSQEYLAQHQVAYDISNHDRFSTPYSSPLRNRRRCQLRSTQRAYRELTETE